MVNKSENKGNACHLDPSKAWIKNIGPGSTRKLKKNHFNRNNDRTELASTWQKTRSHVNETKTNDNKQTPQRNGTVIDLSGKNSVSNVCARESIFVEETVLKDSQASCLIDTLDDERTYAVNDTVIETLMESGIEPLNDTILKDSDQNRVEDKTVVDSSEPVKSSETYTCIDIFSDVSSDIFDKTDAVAAESTMISLNLATCIQMEMAANNLRKMRISNDANEYPEGQKLETDDTLIPPYIQFLTNQNDTNWTLPSPPQSKNEKRGPEIPSISTDEFVQPVYMREADVNRLFNNGYLYFAKGKLCYRDPTRK